MSVDVICTKRWTIGFYKDGDSCYAADYIASKFNEKAQGHIYACLDMLAERGRNGLTIDIFHSAAEGHEIRHNEYLYKMYGFHKGKERLYAILQEDIKTIIFTHGAIKTGQKTAKEDIDKFTEITWKLITEGALP